MTTTRSRFNLHVEIEQHFVLVRIVDLEDPGEDRYAIGPNTIEALRRLWKNADSVERGNIETIVAEYRGTFEGVEAWQR